jgi:hypothetical protein
MGGWCIRTPAGTGLTDRTPSGACALVPIPESPTNQAPIASGPRLVDHPETGQSVLWAPGGVDQADVGWPPGQVGDSATGRKSVYVGPCNSDENKD